VVLAARVLGRAAVLDGKNALQTQSYGAEARGSLTKSEVIVSDGRIAFPAVRKSDILLTMSQEATNELVEDLKETGVLLVDSSSVREIPSTKATVLRFPATDFARKMFGDELYANMVMLGALVQASGLVRAGSVDEAIRENTSRKNAEPNVKAFREGLRLERVC